MLYPVQTLSFVGQVNMEYDAPMCWINMVAPKWGFSAVVAAVVKAGRSHVVGDFSGLERRAGACRVLCERTGRWAK